MKRGLEEWSDVFDGMIYSYSKTIASCFPNEFSPEIIADIKNCKDKFELFAINRSKDEMVCILAESLANPYYKNDFSYFDCKDYVIPEVDISLKNELNKFLADRYEPLKAILLDY